MAVLVSCSKVLLTHDLEDPQPSITIAPHKGTINCAVWSHNNQVIASCGSDGKIMLSHAWKGNTLLDLDAENLKAMPVNSVWFTSNSQYLASGGHDGLLKIWDLKKRALGSSHKYHFSSITSVHWNMDDSIVASSSLTGDIVLHSTKFGTQIANFTQKGSQGVKMIKFSPFISNNIASAGIDGSIFVWDINTRQPAATFLSNHTSRVNAISFSSFNPVLMCSAGLDRTVNFYDIREKKVVKTLQTDSPLTALAFHNDGHTIVVGTLYGGLYVYDLKAAGTVKTYLKGHEDTQVNFVDFVRPEDSKMETSLLEEPKQVAAPSSAGLAREQSIKKPIGEMGTPSVRGIAEPMSAIVPRTSYSKAQQDEPKSALDPNNELSAKFENIEEFRKQALEAKKTEKTLNNSRASGNSIPGFTTPMTATSQIETKLEAVPSERGAFGGVQSGVKDGMQGSKMFGHMQSIQKEPIREPMNIETQKLNDLNRSIAESLNQKTDTYVNRVDKSHEFTPQQKDFIKDCLKEQREAFKESLFDLQSNVGESLGNLHLEVIRQFEIQKNEIDAKLERYFTEFNSLFQRNEELRKENERLKKTSY